MWATWSDLCDGSAQGDQTPTLRGQETFDVRNVHAGEPVQGSTRMPLMVVRRFTRQPADRLPDVSCQ
jgi:hypothetical protein